MLTLPNVVILLLSVVAICYIYCKYKYNYWRSRGVPVREPTFPFGNLLDFVSSGGAIGESIRKMCNDRDGPYFGFYVVTKPFLIITDPNLIKNILIKDFHIFSCRHIFTDPKVEPVLCNSLLALKGRHWKTLRKQLSPVFTSGKIKMMMRLMTECGKNLEAYISKMEGKNLEMKDISAKYTTDVISSCAFGINANSFVDEKSDFRRHGKVMFSNTFFRSLKAFSYFLAPLFVKIFKYRFIDEKAAAFFSKVFTDVINQREKSEVKRNDLVDILIETKNQDMGDDDFKLDGDRLVAQAVIFFGAGHETTSSTIAFTLHELCINAEIQQKLRDNITGKIAEHGGLTYEAVQDMKYLDMVVSETLRKYPVTPFINRECNENYKVEETGLIIEKGTPVLISQDVMHWNPKYFPNPEKYDPERFNENNKHEINNYVYLPFGEGPRTCIGERFGLLSVKLGIIYIVKNFQLSRNSQTKEPLEFTRSPLRTSKNGIRLTCTKLF